MKILCLGNNTTDTDTRTQKLALSMQQKCHGLLSSIDSPITSDKYERPGYYHSSIYDVPYGDLVELALNFDRVILLDQSKNEYNHPNAFFTTIKVAQELRQQMSVEFQNASFEKPIDFFTNLVIENESFCIFPFIELLVNNSSTTVCCRSLYPITTLNNLTDFGTDLNYQTIRQKMIKGIKVPEHCGSCYKVESRGVQSARQVETPIWANILGLNSLEDLQNIKKPAYYEVRPGNVCNLQCRSCTPMLSSLVASEYRIIGLSKHNDDDFSFENFDFVDFDGLKKLYVAGGEPTANKEFYKFLDRCVTTGQTNFEFHVNTNAAKFNNRFKEQISHFSNLQFIISIDGFEKVNDYMRWLSNWSTIVENAEYLSQRHKCIFNTTVSIYNVANLYNLLKFFDDNFPDNGVHCQFAESNNDILSPFNFPNKDLVLDDLVKIRSLHCYKNDPLLASTIEGLIFHYSGNFVLDLAKLEKFFEFNDLLDKSRNVKLVNYVPELEYTRKFIQ